MVARIKKALQYLLMRFFEMRISILEFNHCSKLNSSAYESFFKNGILVEVHSIEKGLGLKNTQPGHSAKLVINLINKMFGYIERGYSTKAFAFTEAYCVIAAYIDYQQNFDISKFPELVVIERKFEILTERLDKRLVNSIENSLNGGARIISKGELLKGKGFDFESFIKTRHSIRMYEDKPIEMEEIKKAVHIANQSPSACNRQPSMVYFSSEKRIVDKIDGLITGSSGFKGCTPNYIIVTTDRSKFIKDEQFQWYINGGIYLSYLTLALHSLGIGNCIMQWKAFYKTEKELKKMMGIVSNEAIIAVVGCGYYQDDTKCIYAQRKTAEESLRIVGN